MPEVICDTSVLQYLHQLDLLNLLSSLYGRVIGPDALAQEIAAGQVLGVDLPELMVLPWIEVQPGVLPLMTPTDLGAGELAVLSLASTRSGCLVLIDDGLARRYARLAGIGFTGTCGILLQAKRRGLIPAIKPLLDQLGILGFRLDSETRCSVLELAGEDGQR